MQLNLISSKYRSSTATCGFLILTCDGFVHGPSRWESCTNCFLWTGFSVWLSSNSIFPLILNLVDFWTIIHRSKLLLKDDGYTLLLSDLLNLFSWPQEGAVNRSECLDGHEVLSNQRQLWVGSKCNAICHFRWYIRVVSYQQRHMQHL